MLKSIIFIDDVTILKLYCTSVIW